MGYPLTTENYRATLRKAAKAAADVLKAELGDSWSYIPTIDLVRQRRAATPTAARAMKSQIENEAFERIVETLADATYYTGFDIERDEEAEADRIENNNSAFGYGRPDNMAARDLI